ncbi:MAG: hypothetical protein QOI08_4437, partial [Actinomycetota bacterium]|nr:hypothetical protein [Actinomycetota bacterium]
MDLVVGRVTLDRWGVAPSSYVERA